MAMLPFGMRTPTVTTLRASSIRIGPRVIASPVEAAAETPRAVLSGAEYELRVLAAAKGDIHAIGEIEAIQMFLWEGKNVHVQTPMGSVGPNTADLRVGGPPGTGVGGVPWEVYTPGRGTNANNIVLNLNEKTAQSPNLILNLRYSSVTFAELEAAGELIPRIRNFDPANPVTINTVVVMQ
jgi:hypothetical protein